MSKVAQAHPFKPNPLQPGVTPRGEGVASDATNVIWQNPSAYNPLTQGPPYLPGMTVAMDKSASQKPIQLKLAMSEGSELPSYLVLLRALATIHQSHHWLTFGADFYGDHLLFERLYDQTLEEIDGLAEKAIGVGCDLHAMQPGLQAELMTQVVTNFCNVPEEGTPASLVKTSLVAEQHFLTCAKQIVEILKGRGRLSRGVDNLLAGIEDNHENHLYLLGQRSKNDPWKACGA